MGRFLRRLTLAAALSIAAVPAWVAAQEAKLNVNAASAAELAHVPGFDNLIAARIIARRASKGPFHSLDELLEIQGVTKLTLITAVDHLEIGAPPAAATPAPIAAPAAAATGKKLDLNKATFAQLLLLPEMTPGAAKSIVVYREKNGGFRSIDDLGRVPGLDKTILIQLVDQVTVSGGGGAVAVVSTPAPTPTPVATVAMVETPPPAATPVPLAPGEKIDLNTAGREDIVRLPEMGPIMAERIADFRDKNGPFRDLDAVRSVRGMTSQKIAAIRPWVTLSGMATPAPRATPTARVVAIASHGAATPAATPLALATGTSVASLALHSPAIGNDGRVNINLAGVDELLTLPRMTREVAQLIVDYRDKNGPFRDTHGIVQVPTIGEATWDRLRDHMTVGAPR